jgi:hypothetical protein
MRPCLLKRRAMKIWLTRDWRIALAAAMLAVPCADAAAQGPAVDPSIGHVDVTVEVPKETPYVGEMLVVRMRTAIRANIALHTIRQPSLTDFDWQQFGKDSDFQEMRDGFWVAGVERVIAVYPRRPGRLTIEPFVRHVTIITASNERVEADFASKPIEIEVRDHDGIGRAGDWWLPARSVKITDSWEPRPDRIGLDETARRTLTVEAAGITADRLPPLPNPRAPGVITFAGPVERQTIVTTEGPIARAVYRWDIRPVSDAGATLPAIHLPWFDIAERRMRDAAIPEQRVRFVSATGDARETAAKPGKSGLLSAWPLLAGAASFVWTMAVIFLIATSGALRLGGWRVLSPSHRAIAALRSAARRRDVATFRAALGALAKLDPDLWRRVAAEPHVAPGLAVIDAGLFGAGMPDAPGLPPLARIIATAWKRFGTDAAPEGSALMPIDACAASVEPPVRGWLHRMDS